MTISASWYFTTQSSGELCSFFTFSINVLFKKTVALFVWHHVQCVPSKKSAMQQATMHFVINGM